MNVVTGAVSYMECSALAQQGLEEVRDKMVDAYEAAQSAAGRGARAKQWLKWPWKRWVCARCITVRGK